MKAKIIEVIKNYENTNFTEVRDTINDYFEDDSLAWEMGPHPIEESKVVLSLSLYNESEKINRLIQKRKIPIYDCAINIVAGIPPRNWDRFFEYTNKKNEIKKVDCNKWLFSISPQRNEIIIKTDVDYSEDKNEIIGIFLNGELGEKNTLDYFKNITSGKCEDMKTISELRSTFKKVYPKCEYADLF